MVGVGGVVDPSAYERVTVGTRLVVNCWRRPAAAAVSSGSGARVRVLLPTTDAAVYVNAKRITPSCVDEKRGRRRRRKRWGGSR